MIVIDILSVILISLGLLFFSGAAVGLIRFPDFYTRMHAAGKGDSLSTLLILAGFALQLVHQFDGLDLLVIGKILAIAAFIMLTSPTSTHALMDAGYEDGIEPLIAKGGKNDLAKDIPQPDQDSNG